MSNNLSDSKKESEGGANQNFLFVALFLFILIFFIILVTLNIGQGKNNAGSFIKDLKLHSSQEKQDSGYLTAAQQKLLMYKDNYWDRLDPVINSNPIVTIEELNASNPDNYKIAELIFNKQQFLQDGQNISNKAREVIKTLSSNQNIIEDIPLKFQIIYPISKNGIYEEEVTLLENISRYYAYLGSNANFNFSSDNQLDLDLVYIRLSIIR
jgi:hypothetical protein